MENWAYIYILNEETEQANEQASVEHPPLDGRFCSNDREVQATVRSQSVASAACGPDMNADFVSYPSYFFL